MLRNRQESFNENWEAEIEAFDAEQKRLDREYYDRHFIVKGGAASGLTEEENLVLDLFLSGTSCEEIAKQNSVDLEVVTGLLEIIRAKLSLNE